jgi:hypothetical protein
VFVGQVGGGDALKGDKGWDADKESKEREKEKEGTCILLRIALRPCAGTLVAVPGGEKGGSDRPFGIADGAPGAGDGGRQVGGMGGVKGGGNTGAAVTGEGEGGGGVTLWGQLAVVCYLPRAAGAEGKAGVGGGGGVGVGGHDKGGDGEGSRSGIARPPAGVGHSGGDLAGMPEIELSQVAIAAAMSCALLPAVYSANRCIFAGCC